MASTFKSGEGVKAPATSVPGTSNTKLADVSSSVVKPTRMIPKLSLTYEPPLMAVLNNLGIMSR